MQVIAGARKPETKSVKEVGKLIPTRLIRLFLRISQLNRGRYILCLSVGDDEISWSLSEMGKPER